MKAVIAIGVGLAGIGIIASAAASVTQLQPSGTSAPAFSTSGYSPLVLAWAAAIEQEENSSVHDTEAKRNNVGNLRTLGVFREFDTKEEGRTALYDDLTAKLRKYPGYTWYAIMERYAPAKDGNDPVAYAEFCVSWINSALGSRISANDILSDSQASLA